MIQAYDPLVRRVAIELVSANGGVINEELVLRIREITETQVSAHAIRRWWNGWSADIGDEFDDKYAGQHRAKSRKKAAPAPSVDVFDTDEFSAILEPVERLEYLKNAYLDRLASPAMILDVPEVAVRTARVVALLSEEIRKTRKFPPKMIELMSQVMDILEKKQIPYERFFSTMITKMNDSMMSDAPRIEATIVAEPIEYNEADGPVIDLDVEDVDV